MQWVFAGVGTLFVLLAVIFGVNAMSSFPNALTSIGMGVVSCGFAVGGGLCLLAAGVAHRGEFRRLTQSQAVRIADQEEKINRLERELQAKNVSYPNAGRGEGPT